MELEDSSSSTHSHVRDDGLALRRARNELRRAAQLAVAGELVASITHDLRQPLTAVEMNVSAAIHFLQRGVPAIDDAIDALEDALRQQHRMRDALQVLQDLAVRREPHWSSFDVATVVREVVALVGTDALVRHVPIELDVADPVPPVAGDAMLFRQALLNVVLDALEATSMHGQALGPVRIAVHRTPDHTLVDIAVAHPSARADGVRPPGWGLALARSVAAAHGARLEVDGSVTTGITATLHWPTERPVSPPTELNDA